MQWVHGKKNLLKRSPNATAQNTRRYTMLERKPTVRSKILRRQSESHSSTKKVFYQGVVREPSCPIPSRITVFLLRFTLPFHPLFIHSPAFLKFLVLTSWVPCIRYNFLRVKLSNLKTPRNQTSYQTQAANTPSLNFIYFLSTQSRTSQFTTSTTKTWSTCKSAPNIPITHTKSTPSVCRRNYASVYTSPGTTTLRR